MTVWDCRVDMHEQKRDKVVENQKKKCTVVNFFLLGWGMGNNIKRDRKKEKE
jgi:hypothetical protein